MGNILTGLRRSEKKYSERLPHSVTERVGRTTASKREASLPIGRNVTDDAASNADPFSRSESGVLEGKHIQTLNISSPVENRLVSLMLHDNAGSEGFRLLGIRLRHLQQEKALKRLLITSTVPREGKSTAAANLSCSLAKRGDQRVLLLEGDLRRPSLAKMFGLRTLPGLYERVQDGRPIFSCIYYLEEAHLWLLPAGSPPVDAPELLRPEGLNALLDRLSECFDWIIIDSPPVLPIADTSIWMPLSDAIVLVVRQGVSEKRPLERGIKALESKKLIGVLLNCSRTAPHSEYYCNPTWD